MMREVTGQMLAPHCLRSAVMSGLPVLSEGSYSMHCYKILIDLKVVQHPQQPQHVRQQMT